MWRYLVVMILSALLFYALLLINRNKAKSAIARLGIIPLLSGALFQVFYYHMLGHSAYKEWYWIAQLILIVLVVSLMLGMLFTPFRKVRAFRLAVWTLVAACGVYMGLNYWSYFQGNMTHGEWTADAPYFDISSFLEQNTEPGSIIGMTGGGNAGYFIHDRTIVNMDGLINSYTYFQLLKEKQAGKYLADMGMNYVLANISILDSLPYRGQYQLFLEPTGLRYGGKDLSRYHAP
jgi:hypothetical protein